jgi:pilus assembly protein Flp/PilA
MIKAFGMFLADDTGATAIEYGLIAALMAIGLIGAAQNFKGALSNIFDSVGVELGNTSAAAAE